MLPIESERVQRAIFGASGLMPRPSADHLGAPIPNASRLAQSAWLARAGSGRAGTRRAAGRWRAGRCFLLLDKTVSDGLSGGQGPAAARVLADLVHLAAGHVGQPEVQRVEHAGYLLLAGADRGHRAAEMQPGLGRSEEHTSELQSPCNLV